MTDRAFETVTIAAEEAGGRLDRVLAARIPSLSRSRLKALILDGQVTIAARTIRDPATPVNSGDVITVALPAPEPASPRGEAIPLNIVYEDDELIVIDKPAGLVVHPAAGHAAGTLVNALIAHCGDEPFRHRRRQAAGHRAPARQGHQRLMVVAKTDRAHRALSAQFANKTESGLERGYLALVWGAPARPKGTIDAPLDRHPAGPRQTRRARRRPRAVTHWQVLERYAGKTTVKPEARRQPSCLHPRDRPHPPDPGASRPYRPPDHGRSDLRRRLQDQGQPARCRRPARRWKTLKDRLCMPICWLSNTP